MTIWTKSDCFSDISNCFCCDVTSTSMVVFRCEEGEEAEPELYCFEDFISYDLQPPRPPLERTVSVNPEVYHSLSRWEMNILASKKKSQNSHQVVFKLSYISVAKCRQRHLHSDTVTQAISIAILILDIRTAKLSPKSSP